MRLQGVTLDYVAGAYVLGTLPLRARRRFDRLLRTSAAARDAQQLWEQRLSGLAQWAPSIRPEPQTWQAIAARLLARQGMPAKSTRRPWQQLLAAVVVGASLALGWFFYDQTRQPALVASIADPSGAQLWSFEAPKDGARLVVTPRRDGLVPAGRAYEIWALPTGAGAPVSLGLVPASGSVVLSLNQAQRTALLAAQQIALTVEPPGGSPNGVPTGPVIHVAPISRAS